ncbi:MAG: hypothetical protein A2381_11890 [Bdellovibrionales bacterium RIFOXYB1_FULL_37_110]|nr:MAG: hypothetical protein A2181_05955 [Bdellovibrionales bacterium RIFOXYA1_FULL_38_20]OFZ49257.1 MAG: hypothetical protein A2417_17130 [Bdellovibrionales bacterium RIFOXYC1_FULL_37_79]OFZ58505.1 MAG: hypothetical protein A2381_11890 [Bdellovibrionales bacterium RIFOXYB1_FULL_37_110]
MNQGACLIPDRPWFKIDEVCKVTGVREYIIKFWEKEFAELGMPENNQPKNFYSRKDLETILLIKSLLFDKKLTVDEAKVELSGTQLPLENFMGELLPDKAETVTDPVLESEDQREQISVLSRKLSAILSITNNVKSVHNWY